MVDNAGRARVGVDRELRLRDRLAGSDVERLAARSGGPRLAAGLKRLRYAAFATSGTWCVARLESFDRDGNRLWRSEDLRKKSCPN
jgi:hypothetical protein